MKRTTLLTAFLLMGIFNATFAIAQDGAKPALGTWGVETQNVSESITPGDDFYKYVNDGWLATAELPQGLPMNGAFVDVMLKSEEQVKAILAELAHGQGMDVTGAAQVKAFYDSYMDEAKLEELGITPIQPWLDEIIATQSHSDIAALMGTPGYKSVISVSVDLDAKNPELYTALVSQSGIGLPDASFYLQEGEPYAGFRTAYLAYITDMLTKAAIDKPAERAQDILDFETEIAKAHWTPAEKRDPVKTYHAMNKAEFVAYTEGFHWDAYLKATGASAHDQFILKQDTAVQKIAALFGATPLETLQSYMAFHTIDGNANFLSSEFEQAHFEFFDRTLNSIQEQRPRDKRAQGFINVMLGELMGRIYVDRYFPASSKKAMEEYIPFIRSAYRARIEQSDWMDDATKAEALDKLKNFGVKIGYPDQWRDFSGLEIKVDDLVGNIHRVNAWMNDDMVAKLGRPVEKWEWLMNPQEINAYYEPKRNEIVFPAGILQPSFFDPNADRAANFAAIGAVIGHELGHGFDDQGSAYDGKGMLRN